MSVADGKLTLSSVISPDWYEQILPFLDVK